MVAKPTRQIFQTSHLTRWKSFKWIFRVITTIICLVIIGLIASLLNRDKVRIPELGNGLLTKLSIKEISASFSPSTRKEFTKDIDLVRKNPHRDIYELNVAPAHNRKIKLPVRAGFYVNWDVQATYSLRKNIDKLNMVVPEWFFVADTGDEIAINIDSAGLDIMRKRQVAIIPMISNFFNQKWNGNNVHRILTSEKRRTTFIKSVVKTLDHYHFQGVNVDFEELVENNDEYLILFMTELYNNLHAKGYLVTQDISPFNEDYNVGELAKVSDFLFLMGYDQHNANSLPGPIGAMKWVEQALDEICEKTKSEKVILCIPAFGYDWPVGYHGEDLTYEEAITRASENEEPIVYDNDNYNLSFTYQDDKNIKHVVWFTDACTDFNIIRASEDFGTSGVAIWRLGSEDNRIWRFYDRRLTLDSLKKFPFLPSRLEHVTSSYNIDYIGAGEILDIMSAPKDGYINIEMDTEEQLIAEQKYITLPTSYVIEKTGEIDKKIALTFDDGPDQKYTPEILDILKSYHIQATFFVVGVNCQQNVPLLNRIYHEGHEIGNHTFTHPDLEEISDERERIELRSTNLIISGITGHSTILFRSPFNTDAEPSNSYQIHPMKIAKEEGFITIGSSIDPRDWEKGVSADTIFSRAIQQKNLGNIILFHDGGSNREQTVMALPRIINYYRKHGFSFVTVSDLMGRSRQEVMPVRSNQYLGAFETFVIFGSYIGQLFLLGLFFLALGLIIGKTLTNGILASYQRWKEKKKTEFPIEQTAQVSIIVPAFNEEKTIVRTISNLLKTEYSRFEIIVIDDGSTDNTLVILKELFGNNNKIRIISKTNGGKASALQEGISNSTGDILVCIDADTILDPHAVSKLLGYFTSPKVAAVAGNVKVGNCVNMITNWQSIEYTTSQNFDRRAFDLLNSIMVIPGAIGAFRKEVVLKVGGFTSDTLAEDCDLTLRLVREGYTVRTCSGALAYTEAPETVRMFFRQRFRWTFGIMQSFWKHKDLIFNTKQKNMGWVILPNILIFQMLLPLFSPLVDLMMIFAMFSHNMSHLLFSYLLYLLLDALVAWLAYHFDSEQLGLKNLLYLSIQRLVYRQLMWFVLIKSYMRAIKGELSQWGVLTRTGTVKLGYNIKNKE